VSFYCVDFKILSIDNKDLQHQIETWEENEFDGVKTAVSVRLTCLLGSANGAAPGWIRRVRQQADDGRCVCQQLELSAGVHHAETMEALAERTNRRATLRRQQAQTEHGSEGNSQTRLDPEVQEVVVSARKVLAGRIGLDEHSVDGKERRSYLYCSSVLSGPDFVVSQVQRRFFKSARS
jgi:hypothetical protein